MQVLQYTDLDVSSVLPAYRRLLQQLQTNNFKEAQIKKLQPTPYYRAKLDYDHRLLFKVLKQGDEKVIVLLELIRNHAYDRSRFLRGATIDESKIQEITELGSLQTEESLPYLNPQSPYCHLLDKIVCLDPSQEALYQQALPLMIIGSAGSGKTVLTLEKMKQCVGQILYLSHSPYLVAHARTLYYANHYSNDSQNIDFLSYQELLHSIQIPQGQEIQFRHFLAWLQSFHDPKLLRKASALYEEFKGVITGNRLDQPHLSKNEYLNLGLKQSICAIEERESVYSLFEKYLAFLKKQNLYDLNLLSFEYLPLCQSLYDLVVVDEIQDFTPVQLKLILSTAKDPQQFLLCGDSNQIIHPNFFSWAKLKTFFYQDQPETTTTILRVLHKNYRNAKAITQLANQLLKLKNARFGSIDKESHFLVESFSEHPGAIYSCLAQTKIYTEFNEKTAQSTRFAVLVLDETHKKQAAQYFKTPLIFSIQEAKGLEYDHVILYRFVSSEPQAFQAIAQGLSPANLDTDWTYKRAKDKTDHSLEIYKFYINALYVGITRAIKTVYFIENENHPLLDLLDLKPSSTLKPILHQTSSLEDWQQEAHRLQAQGKEEQAEAIRQSVLGIQATPWKPLDLQALDELKSKALNPSLKDKAARLLLFEYAILHEQVNLIDELKQVGFIPKTTAEKSLELLNRKYFLFYTSKNTTTLFKDIDQYGLDFRDRFNYTPLMVACRFGHHELATQLIHKGANLDLIDNLGRNAFQMILQQLLQPKKNLKHALTALYESVATQTIDLEIDHKLVKIDRQRLEFLLVQIMFILNLGQDPKRPLAFQAGYFLEVFEHFPSQIVSEQRKKRSYISSLLSKHEVHRQDPYNRKLFLRVKHGTYSLNPTLNFKKPLPINTDLDVSVMDSSPSNLPLCQSTEVQTKLKAQVTEKDFI